MNKNIFNKLSDFEKKILKISAQKWFRNPAGIAAIDFEDSLSLRNRQIMLIIEGLVLKGLGTINKNVKLYSIKWDIQKNAAFSEIKKKIITHVFFPSKEVLNYFFYKSDLAKEDIPEYLKRLHLGAFQYGLVFFDEEVLQKYFDHPETYNIEDTMAGGFVGTNGDTNEDKYVHVRYGKKKINNGKTAVSAIYTDLSKMSPDEQKYWSSYEIMEFISDKNDSNFKIFIKSTFEGDWIEYPDPIKEILMLLEKFNLLFHNQILFQKTENIHLRPPVQNTKKDFCNSCSELYKLIGPDNINQESIKFFLKKYFKVTDKAFIHEESGRKLSTLELFRIFEQKIYNIESLSDQIKKVQKFRTEADHKILEKDKCKENYSSLFYEICYEYKQRSLVLLEKSLELISKNQASSPESI